MYSVIVVDGDTETVELLKTGVEWNRLGCRLAGTALSIKEGLFLVQTEKPDLVITDMRIGREKENDFLRILYERQQEKRPLVIILSACRDFEEACRAIRGMQRQDASSIPVIAMTANSFQEDADAAAEAGMDGFVTKPVDAEYLCQVLERAQRLG